MFDKFGEMNSYTEINELAANLLQEGDLDSLKELAKENGIPDDYVEMYLEEAIPSSAIPHLQLLVRSMWNA